MIATSISQSKRLLEAGIDPQTADMRWDGSGETISAETDEYMLVAAPYSPICDQLLHVIEQAERDKEEFGLDDGEDRLCRNILDRTKPAWSLSALILLLPERTFYRIARARGKNIEGIFEDCVTYLCKEK